MSGLDLQQSCRKPGLGTNRVMTGNADVGMNVRATKGGAINFPQKPLREHDVLDTVVRTETVHPTRGRSQAYPKEFVITSFLLLAGKKRSSIGIAEAY
ncbi:hypothetical protein ELI54_34185 [Rhizobium ruizarguesonis]|nr:hypothetical protein ELI56_27090 [Rhizobium ruizarguesonis]TAT74642.1 hypothetical protein ELI54_34185 [Rhizobium ruizarguesonis]TAZ65719.1 hypothetical protein ELH70_32570 [Rhizobium ruizarguesonis]TAZ90741.1 hypothetical protein ELH69_26850 [Rhizobium ruizarguesonis]TBB82001.1 hypothetical protein ELH41_31370 [Rhizobium ruizarguesonis]